MPDPETIEQRLRAMSRHEHDDLSIGDEAADLIASLRAERDALALVARRIVEWVRAVDADPDDLEYLNRDGWDDIRETADMARAALAAGEGGDE